MSGLRGLAPNDDAQRRRARPLLAVSVGCPAGIGPEVAVRAAFELPRETANVVLVGDFEVLDRARALVAPDAVLARVPTARAAGAVERAAEPPASSRGSAIAVLAASEALAAPLTFGKPDAACGLAQLAWIDRAADLVAAGEADALVTGPASKAAIARSGAPGAAAFRGHTEHLAARFGAGEPTMAFVSGRLATALVTTHLPLASVAAAITVERVERAVGALVSMLERLGKGGGRVVVASLNPHAGEDGLLGREEIDAIAPAVARARARLEAAGSSVTVEGPMGAESAYRLAMDGVFAGVVAMYHDQATIACKLTGFGEAVNVTLGLPFVRTSVDHGTGYDIAGSGRASARGMLEAMTLAAALVTGGATDL